MKEREMDQSYWHKKAMNQRRKELLDKSRQGNSYAAQKLLSSSLGALAKAIAGEELAEADRTTLDFLRTGLHDYLIGGRELELALGIEREGGGRPRVDDHTKHEIFAWITNEIKRLRNGGESAPTKIAQRNAARHFGITERKARAIWSDEPGKQLKRQGNF